MVAVTVTDTVLIGAQTGIHDPDRTIGSTSAAPLSPAAGLSACRPVGRRPAAHSLSVNKVGLAGAGRGGAFGVFFRRRAGCLRSTGRSGAIHSQRPGPPASR
jgi:hypothetical protein